MTTDQNLAAALYFIPSHDYETWYRVASALKGALGDAGYSLFVSWSSTAPNHEKVKGSTRSCWRSVSGRIPVGYIYRLAKENGWQGEPPEHSPDPGLDSRARAAMDADKRERAENAKRARAKAEVIVKSASYETHPYLESKGFPEERGLVSDGMLVIPVRSWRNSRNLFSVQNIDAQGVKKFLAGSVVGGGVFTLGANYQSIRWFCEGYATGLTIRRALSDMNRERDVIYVCFSAYNIQRVIKEMGTQANYHSTTPSYIIADHDWHTCTNPECKHRWGQPYTGDVSECPVCGYGRVSYPAGDKAAMATRLDYWKPPEPGTDANDLMVSGGMEAVTQALSRLVY